jgi:competence protein ComEC
VILLQVALAFLVGVAVAALGLDAGWPLLVLGGAGLSLGWVLAGHRRQAVLASVLLLVALLGVNAYVGARPLADPGGIAALNDLKDGNGRDLAVSIRGTVVDEPKEGEVTRRFTVDVDSYRYTAGDWRSAEGKVRVVSRLYPEYARGDVLELTGRLQEPPVLDTFDYREYLARRGVVSTALYPSIRVLEAATPAGPRSWLDGARGTLARSLMGALPEPESALARGILLGQRASIPDAVTDDFNRAGISHLIAISGQNVVLVAGSVVATLAGFIGRRPATGIAIAVVWLYVAFVGASPTVLRAGIMGTVMLGAEIAGRPGRGLSSLVLAAAVMVALNPLVVDEVPFQLSFAACLGIVLLQRPLRDFMEPSLQRLPGWLARPVAENLGVTSAAGLAVLPVIGLTFGRVSLISLPANLFAVPAFVLALYGSFFSAVLGAVLPDAGRLAAGIAYLPLTFLVRLGSLASGLPIASAQVDTLAAIAAAVITYAFLASIYFHLRERTTAEEPPRSAPPLRPAIAGAALMTVAAVMTWWSALEPDNDRLSVTILDIGQGDAILIESPAGHRILVDGGPSGARLLNALGRALPVWERRIDLIVLTHPQDDHVTGFVELLRRFEVGAALAGPLGGESGAYLAFRQELTRRRVPLFTTAAGQRIDLGDGVSLEVLAPPEDGPHGTEDDVNNNSIVLRLVHGDVSFLLTGDLAAEGEVALLASGAGVRSTVLKVGHHGSDGSTMPWFLEAVQPEFAVISSGEDNTFGHPSPTTRLRLAGIPLLRTDRNGDVRFETDGSALWVRSQRGDSELLEPVASR